jgi:hypothetical protein
MMGLRRRTNAMLTSFFGGTRNAEFGIENLLSFRSTVVSVTEMYALFRHDTCINSIRRKYL